MRKDKYKSNFGNYGWGKIFQTTELGKCKTVNFIQESKYKFGLVVKLKTID